MGEGLVFGHRGLSRLMQQMAGMQPSPAVGHWIVPFAVIGNNYSLGRKIPIEDVQVFGLQWLPEGNNPIRAASMTVMIAGWLTRRSAVIAQKLS